MPQAIKLEPTHFNINRNEKSNRINTDCLACQPAENRIVLAAQLFLEPSEGWITVEGFPDRQDQAAGPSGEAT